jgi:hypothetical protein
MPMNEIEKIVYQAKLAEQAERYDEMVRPRLSPSPTRARVLCHRAAA